MNTHPLDSSKTPPRFGAGTRRSFLTRAGVLGGAAVLGFPFVGDVRGANERIRVASIGVGGRGDADSSEAAAAGAEIVAMCDVSKKTLDRKAVQFPRAKQFRDYRRMLESIGREIDAVTVSTPDHHHGLAASMAMRMGKHCFCQKPLTQTIHEARELRGLAAAKKLATQMGNQGSAADSLRRAVEVIQSGVIGNPLELHVWTNRPQWPQGIERPAGGDPVPDWLDWDVWLGPAPKRPYKQGAYHTFRWRGWYDFGTGALGDMACHTVNMPFRALKLGYPTAVECEMASRLYPESFPKTSRIRYEFPAREGLPPLKFWWYDGNPKDAFKPLRPPTDLAEEVLATLGNLPESGSLIIGDKGKVLSPGDDGGGFLLCLKGEREMLSGDKHEAARAVARTIPRSPGHMEEWIRMMRDGTPAYSNFDVAAYLTEIILLGCVALRVGEGARVDWDGPNLRSPNRPEAARFVRRENRRGWRE